MTNAVAIAGCLLALAGAPQERESSPLAPGRRIYVNPADAATVADEPTAALRKWGRRSVVERQGDADLMATIALEGSPKKGTVTVTITKSSGGPTLWQGEDSGRKRGKASGYSRALAVIVEQLKEASNRWPAS